MWSVLLIFLVFCVMLCFVYGLSILDCPFVYGLSILDCPFVYGLSILDCPFAYGLSILDCPFVYGLSILQFYLSFIHIGPFIIPIYAFWLIWVDELYLIDEIFINDRILRKSLTSYTAINTIGTTSEHFFVILKVLE